MKRIIFIITIAFSATSVLSQTPCHRAYAPRENCVQSAAGILSQSVSQGEAIKDKTEEKLRRLHEEWAKALMSGDAAALDRLLADDFIETDADGEFWHKPQKIELLEKFKGELKADASDGVLRVYGKTAIVTGRFTIKRKTDEEKICRYTVIYLKRGGRWQIAAAQLTHVQPEFTAKN